MYHIIFIHSSVDGHLGCSRVLTSVYRAAVNTGVHAVFFFFELWLSQGVCPVVGLLDYMVETGATCGSVGKESACNAGDAGSIPGWGRSPGGGHGNPLQYCCLENPMDRGTW